MARMKVTVVLTVAMMVYGAGIIHVVRAAQATTTWSGVYTEAQAKLGEKEYLARCSECHGKDLQGDGVAPSLKGAEFNANWNGLTVGDLFERIRSSMPPDDPAAVGDKEKAAIVAYLLAQAGFPAGSAELRPSADALKSIKFQASKPGR